MLFNKNKTGQQLNGYSPSSNRPKIIALAALIAFIILVAIVSALTSTKTSTSENPAPTNIQLQLKEFRTGGYKASIYAPKDFTISTSQPVKLSDPGSSQSILIKKLDYSKEEKFEDLQNKLTLNIEGKAMPGISAQQKTFYKRSVLVLLNKATPLQQDYYIYENSNLWLISITLDKQAKNNQDNLEKLAPQIVASIKREKAPSEEYLTQ
jgi:hypothetical protein